MRSCPRQLAARLPPPRLPTSALAGQTLAVLKVMKDAGQSNTPKTARWGRLSGLVDVRFGSKADIRHSVSDEGAAMWLDNPIVSVVVGGALVLFGTLLGPLKKPRPLHPFLNTRWPASRFPRI